MKALKIVVALSGVLCLFILGVLFREARDSIRPVFGDWSDLMSFLIIAWTTVMMVLGNMGLYWFIGGFKKGVAK